MRIFTLDISAGARRNIRMSGAKPTLPEANVAEPVTRKSKTKPRPTRRSEENEPDRNYLRKMERLGPREGESLIAYRKRMAAVREGRRLWISIWRQYKANRAECARALGVPKQNIAYELRMVGLSTAILDRMRRLNNWEEL